MNHLLLCALLLASKIPLSTAQDRLAGLWQGKLVKDGQAYPLQLYLVQRGSQIEGKSWLYEPDGHITEMKIFGVVHRDWSVTLYEAVPPSGHLAGERFDFPRDYQLLFERSIWKQTLEGYWQKQTGLPLQADTPHGKVSLRKVKRTPRA